MAQKIDFTPLPSDQQDNAPIPKVVPDKPQAPSITDMFSNLSSGVNNFINAHPTVRQVGQRLMTGFSDEDRLALRNQGVTGVQTGYESWLPEMEHPENEGWSGYLGRGFYNQIIRPLGSPMGFVLTSAPEDTGNTSKTAGAADDLVRLAKRDVKKEIKDDTKDEITQGDIESRLNDQFNATTPPTSNAQPPLSSLSPKDKIIAALDRAVPARAKQEEIYTLERAKRFAAAEQTPITSEESALKAKSALGGEYPKIDFQPLRNELSQEDVDSIFKMIGDNSRLSLPEKVRSADAIRKILSGVVPQDNEIDVLQRTFGPDFSKALMDRRSTMTKAGSLVNEAINMPKAMKASMDFSAPFRQGMGLVHRGEFWRSFDDMMKAGWSENSFKELQESIREKPTFALGQESGLSLTDIGENLSQREEQYVSRLAEKIPIAGRFVRASDRAYTGFLNKLRADTFESLINEAKDAGLNPEGNLVLSKEIANYINVATGRGSLGSLEKHSAALNNLFFSPRFISSRLTMMNPNYYIKASPFVRKQALKSLFAIAGAGSTIAGLGALAGADVSFDPTNTDFMKAKFGNTRIDPFAGFQQYLVAASRLMSGKETLSSSGKTNDLGSLINEFTDPRNAAPGFGRSSRATVLGRFGESKANPVVEFAWSMFRGKDMAGQPFYIPEATANLFIPMLISDVYDVAKDNPALLPIAIPAGTFGLGVQTYPTDSSMANDALNLVGAGR